MTNFGQQGFRILGEKVGLHQDDCCGFHSRVIFWTHFVGMLIHIALKNRGSKMGPI
jgi:hypothetical protein